ncbi:hypothetical protein G6F57_011818 [Rhizopus arrhizus]|uniref:Lipid droplet-associated perilipin protein n=1 Tax=Rhizopus oryzae TaxID=64495 RepID=A0A9P6WX32_RHIOR|nr:hypothetical protein G6F24_008499 [Rhizopus arrhizus]KAG1415063.1 hypothetical protein G6F58_006658 [Rhizopus delemar]KAG0780390.1 hypothetical protein G6F21_012155 [Rhizopus arrhizus]KAG0792819.1 hypothetical protein G6F22_005763 [Rhizopus arrhizus]KAG0807806.1 hypothetical protein G6F20_010080 [Rhizopus arrhizus]
MARNHKQNNQNHQQEHQKEETVVVQEEKEPQIVELLEQEGNNNNHSATTTATKPTTTRFVSRVSSIPVVHDGLSTVQAMANKTSLGRLALSTANSTLTTVSRYAQPKYVQSYYESYIQPRIEKADALGCRSLDIIQTKFPVVNQPTEDILKTPYQMVDGMKVKIDSTFTQPAHQVAKEANKRFGTVVDNVEAVLNRYLPPSEDDGKHQEKEVNQAIRAYYLLNQATFRLSQHVQEQVKTTAGHIPRSPSDLARLAETSALIQRTTANIQSLQASLTLYAQQRLPSTERIQILQVASQERLHCLTGQVSTQLQQVMEFLKAQSTETPEWLKTRVYSLVEIAHKQVDLVRTEYAREDISSVDKAKNVAQGLQSQVLPVLQTIQAQLNHYTQLARQRASHDLKVPFEYLGLSHAPKLAQAQ